VKKIYCLWIYQWCSVLVFGPYCLDFCEFMWFDSGDVLMNVVQLICAYDLRFLLHMRAFLPVGLQLQLT